MGLPADVLSTVPHPDDYLSPIDRARGLLEDWEMGGIALNDTSEGLKYQVWHLTYSSPNFTLTPEDFGPPVVLPLVAANCTEVALAFDANMDYVVCFVQDGQAKFDWYDIEAVGHVTTELEPNARTPRCSLDDRYDLQLASGTPDIIVAYFIDDRLVHRKQRQRYDTVHELATGLPDRDLYRCGMNIGRRFQFGYLEYTGVIVPPVEPPGPPEVQANLDFELGDIYWNKTNEFTITMSDPHAGSWSAIIIANPFEYSTLENSIYTIITPSSSLDISCYVKGTEATSIKLGFRFYNTAKALVGTDTAVFAVSTSWAQIARTVIAPANAVYLRIFVETDATDGTVSLDDFQYDNPLEITVYDVELATPVPYEVDLVATESYEIEL